MIDIVIPLGPGSKWEDNELRYSLRSFEKHLHGIGRVFVIGRTPDWMTGVNFISHPDIYTIPCINTTYKILTACHDPRVSENFLLSNDDFFLLKDHWADLFPYYWRNDLLFHIDKLDPKGSYRRSRIFTAQALQEKGFGIRSFEVHCPFRINKNEFLKMSNIFDWQNGLLPRSLYGNMLNLQAEKRGDYIINLPLSNQSPIERNAFFSIRDGEVNARMQDFFQTLYPVASRFEKQQL